MYLTVVATILMSIFLDLTESWHVHTGNVIVNAVLVVRVSVWVSES